MSYRIGQRVRVAAREHEGHHRTPDYPGHADDRLFVDVFEHWLQEAQ